MPHLWAQKTVVVSGGSKGLGAHIASQAAKQNARVVIIGRNPEALEVTARNLNQLGASEVVCISADAARLNENRDFFAAVEGSGIDLLVNAIGRSDRGTLAQLNVSEFDKMFQDNVSVGLTVTQLCLPYLERNQGVFVNIGSLAGLIAAPYLGAYCASKFALTAITRQWRAELKSKSIHAMLVSCGPIKRDDGNKRYDELIASRGDLPSSVKAPGGGAKLKELDPTALSIRILEEAAKRTPEIVVPAKAKLLAAIAPVFPSLADYILSKTTSK